MRLVCAVVLIAVVLVGATIARAEVPGGAGLIPFVTYNDCLAKRIGCEAPALPDTSDTDELVRGRVARAVHFANIVEYGNALSEVEAALKLGSEDSKLQLYGARLALNLHNFKKAEAELLKLSATSPDNPDVMATRAVMRELQAKPEDALREYDEILTKHPDHRFSRTERSRLRLLSGDPQGAISDLKVLMEERPGDAILRRMRAKARLVIADVAGAVADYDIILQLNPRDMTSRTERAFAHLQMGQEEAALNDLSEILGPVGGSPRYAIGGLVAAKYYTQRALILQKMGRREEAATDIAQSLKESGVPAILRIQVFLRSNGFPETPIDGKDTPALRSAISMCFKLNACFQLLKDKV